ncbi:MAG: efflux RND transporter periplasmic adaptor subunit, partial [Bacteroidales bacterium]|nr:efflux RND transporter periplasmic adaptor subunit [Bacteroidales bacterium]
VIVSVDSCHLRMTPGLSAGCEILIKQVQDTVVIPTLAIYVRDSLKTVYVYNGVDFKPVSIETGLSNSSETIVTKGLTGTETVALMEPPHNFIEKPKKKSDE